jgi:hypothetical protein
LSSEYGRPRADIVALLVVVALMSSRVLTPQEAVAGFGSSVVILIASIFIVSAGLVNTVVAQRLGDAVVKTSRGNETRLVALIMLLAGVIGSVLNSSAVAAMLIPVVWTITKKTGLNRKRLLMPLGVAVMISGMMTLIATSPNIIIENILRERGIASLTFQFHALRSGHARYRYRFYAVGGTQPLEPKAFRGNGRNRLARGFRRHQFLRSQRAVASVNSPGRLVAHRSVGGRGATTATRELRTRSPGL